MVSRRRRAAKRWKSHTLKPQRPTNFKKPKNVHEENVRPVYPQNPTPPSIPMGTQNSQNLEPHTPCIDLMGSSQNPDELCLKNFSVVMPLKSIPPSPKTPSNPVPLYSILPSPETASNMAMVSYKYPLMAYRRRWSKKKRSPMSFYWNKKKLETLSRYFNPIPFSPKKRHLDIASHQVLLTRLGLWNFLNLDFDQMIRTDLIKELVVCYNPKRYANKSYVHGMPITLSRMALATALLLPAKRFNLHAKYDEEGKITVVSQEEASFVEELIWDWLVLRDDDSEVVDNRVLNIKMYIKELRFEKIDWAGLIWCMVQRELLMGKILVNCYYASHLQLLLKSQRPRLFDDHVENVGSSAIGTNAGDVKMLELEDSEKGNGGIVLFEEKLERESCISVGKYIMGLKGSETGHVENVGSSDIGANVGDVKMLELEDSEKGNGGIVLFDEKLEKESCINLGKDIMGLKGSETGQEKEGVLVKCYKRSSEFLEEHMGERDLCIEENIVSDSKEDKLRQQHNGVDLVVGKIASEQQIKNENQDQHQLVLLCESEDDNKRGSLTGLECNEMECQAIDMNFTSDNTGKNLEFNTSMDLLMNTEGLEEGLKMFSGMEDLNRREIGNQHNDLIASEENGEKISILGKQFDTEMEHGNRELIVPHCEKEDKVMEMLVNEECETEVVDLLENGEKNSISGEQFDTELEHGNRELIVVHWEKEDEVMEMLVNKKCETEVVDLLKNGEKNSISGEQFDTEMEHGNRELIMVHCEKEDEVMEMLVNEECETKVVNLLDNREKELLNLQVDLSAEKHSSEGDIVLKQEGNQERHIYDFLKRCEENAESAISHVNDIGAAGVDSMQVTLNALHSEVGSKHCEKEDDVIEDRANKGECEAKIGDLLDNSGKELQNEQDKLPLELQFKNEDEKRSCSLTNLGCDKMDYQEVDLNCREDYVGKEVESGASMDLLMNLEAREEWLKREGSTDFIFGGMDDMNSRQETDNQRIDLVSNQENGEKKFSLEGSGEEGEHVIGEKINISEDQCATEMDHRDNELRLKQPEKEDVMKGLANEEVCDGKNSDFLDKREKELHDIQVDLIAKKHNSDCVDALMEKVNQEYPCIYESSSKRGDWNVEQEASGLNESLAVCMDYLQASLNAMPGKVESVHVVESEGDDDTLLEYEEKGKGKCQINDINTSERFVLPHCTPGNVEEHEASKEKGQAQDTECYDSQKECRQTEDLYSAHRVQLTGAKEVIHNPPNFNVHHSFVEPFVSNLHMHMETLIPSVHEKALQNKDTSKTEIFMGDFASENDMYMNFAGPSRDNPAGREIDCLDGGHHGHGMENKEAIVSNDAYEGESMDLDFCTEQVEVWMERLKNAARKQVQSDHEINGMLLKKLEGQNQTIQQYETMRQKEQQQRQKEVRKYERELHLMQNILQDYRKALKEVHKSFAKYRERYRLPDESVYMDHPSGGGRLILVATWKKLEQEREKKARAMIEAMMKNFEHEWVSKFENHLLNFDLLSDKLEDVEFAFSLLKGKVLNPLDMEI